MRCLEADEAAPADRPQLHGTRVAAQRVPARRRGRRRRERRAVGSEAVQHDLRPTTRRGRDERHALLRVVERGDVEACDRLRDEPRRRALDAWKSGEVQEGVGHLNSPFSSHGNRTWHKLGECAIAFLGEIPLWYHYLAVLLPLAAMAWPRSPAWAKLALFLGAFITSLAGLNTIPIGLSFFSGALMLAVAGWVLWPRREAA